MFLQLGRAGTSMLGKVSRLPVLTPAFTPLLPWSGPSCDYSGSSSIHTRHLTTTNTLQWRKVRESNHGYTALYTAAAAALVTIWKIYHMVHIYILYIAGIVPFYRMSMEFCPCSQSEYIELKNEQTSWKYIRILDVQLLPECPRSLARVRREST